MKKYIFGLVLMIVLTGCAAGKKNTPKIAEMLVKKVRTGVMTKTKQERKK